MTNLLSTLHVTPILDAIGLKEIAKETNNDPTLKYLRDIIQSGKLYIPNDKPQLTSYKQIISEITVLNNGILLKQDKIIQPYSLHEKVIPLANNGSHPVENALKLCLRNHFYIKDLDIKISKYIRDCSYCQMFTQKTTRHPIEPNSVPEKCWEETSIDLFVPLPSSHHVLVIQDLPSRYPVAKIVTNAKSVIPVLRNTYDLFGNSLRKKSDNGPPFNSNEMTKFAQNRNIEQMKSAPGYPAPNNVETIMKPLGKAMKIGNMQTLSEQETLSAFLTSYRDIPMYQLEFRLPMCFFGTVIETTYPITRHQATKLKKLNKQIVTLKRNANPHKTHQGIQ